MTRLVHIEEFGTFEITDEDAERAQRGEAIKLSPFPTDRISEDMRSLYFGELTVAPTTANRCTCPGASPICDGPQLDCPVHGDPDAIMDSGVYVDRRSHVWRGSYDLLYKTTRWEDETTGHAATPDQMRLRIERDQHRDECPGLRRCSEHPVPVVAKSRYGNAWLTRPFTFIHRTLPEAFAAAEQLVKGQNDD